MLRKAVEAVLCDMDGLLIDSEAVYIEAYHAAAQTFGVEMSMALCHAMIGVPRMECEAMIQEHFGPEFRVDRFQLCFREHAEWLMAEEVPVKPGARELLAWLAGRGLPLGVATSSRPTTAGPHLGRAGPLAHFPALTTGYHVERPTPPPDA